MRNFSLSHNHFIRAGVVVLAVLAVYFPSAQNGFVWDDYNLIVDNPLIRDPGSIPSLFLQDYGFGSGHTYNFYRPLQLTIYTAAYQVFGLAPAGYRLLNIAAHAGVSLALYFLLVLLFGSPDKAFWSALLFAVHPLNSEAVLYVSCLADCVSVFFMLAAFIFYVRLQHSHGTRYRILLAGSLLCFLLALLTKELGMVLPFLLLLYHWMFRVKVSKRLMKSFAAVFLGYLAVRCVAVLMLDPKGLSVPLLMRRMPGFFAAVSAYTRLYVLPFGLHMDYGKHFFHWAAPAVVAGIVILGATAGYVLRSPTATPVAFGLAVYGLGLLFHSNLVLYLNQSYMMEHWFYFSALGLSCAASSVIARVMTRPRASMVFLVLVVSLGSLTVRQARFWKDEPALYERSLAFTPDNFRVLNNLCTAYCERGHYDLAVQTCGTALKVIPGSPVALSNLANALFGRGETDAAVGILEGLVARGEASPVMRKNLEYMRRQRGKGAQ